MLNAIDNEIRPILASILRSKGNSTFSEHRRGEKDFCQRFRGLVPIRHLIDALPVSPASAAIVRWLMLDSGRM